MTKTGIVLVSSVSIIRADKVLIIKENKPSVRNKWNFPGGRIEPGEDILDAARREVKEETGYDVKLIGTTGIYNFISNTNNQVIMFHFTGEIIGGSLQLDDIEISECKWIMASDLLIPNLYEIRGEDVIEQIVENLIIGKNHSLSLYNQKLGM
ncbi:NUDIX hydrolase [Paenibacillus sp. WQ 127069]|uniref:NUDIX hydrolase n=1 Tax=Paenibacillus baimaensis TaxID=2982185 RepID=A0ABT2UI28_9BACL|nr:NUDIX hydrolase [Paenibacillus sp. WQ 127069]MCU6794275.1 NUDIX hydrolase [Paenibacillus sp. WQ 127069]